MEPLPKPATLGAHQYTGPSDHTRINLADDHDLRYWSTCFGVTADCIRHGLRREQLSSDTWLRPPPVTSLSRLERAMESTITDKTKRNPLARIKIDLGRDWEVQYWTRQFGCSESELRNAIDEAGSTASAVKKCLAEKH
jgi:hypothetical protein